MTLVESVRTCLSKYVDFTGRGRRSEYWWWYLTVAILNSVIWAVLVAPNATWTSTNGGFSYSASGGGVAVWMLVSLALFLPSLAALVRRLHDTDKSGAFFWIILIPLVGAIILLVFLATEGTRGPNKYGLDPKA